MSIKSQIKQLLNQHHLKPIKHFGQNFLISQKALEKIITTADISDKDTILEIGPGLGILTRELVKRARRVITIEKDRQMIEILKQEFKDYNNLKIIQGDILKDCPWNELTGNYKIAANIPYYLTSPLIRMFLEAKNQPQEMILMLQKEVAQRICAFPPKMSILAVAVQFYAEPKIIFIVSKKSFWPSPKVDSAIVKIYNIRKPQDIDIKKFFKIVKAGFSSPRKFLISNLSKNLKIDKIKIKTALTSCGVPLKARAGELSIEKWRCLSTSPL